MVAGALLSLAVAAGAATRLGYIFLPLEFGTAVIAFGDDALEFLGIAQQAAAALLTIGFVWSAILAVSILRNQSASGRRALAAALPVGVLLVTVLLAWLQWYASGVVVDVT